jgi:hypothetical protein
MKSSLQDPKVFSTVVIARGDTHEGRYEHAPYQGSDSSFRNAHEAPPGFTEIGPEPSRERTTQDPEIFRLVRRISGSIGREHGLPSTVFWHSECFSRS